MWRYLLILYAVGMKGLKVKTTEIPENSPQVSAFGSDQPGIYQIQVRGKIPAGWSEWFSDFTLIQSEDAGGRPITTLTGYLPDQAALHGLLERVRDAGLPLLSVCLSEGGENNVEKTGNQAE
jgi:hypothetical protein